MAGEDGDRFVPGGAHVEELFWGGSLSSRPTKTSRINDSCVQESREPVAKAGAFSFDLLHLWARAKHQIFVTGRARARRGWQLVPEHLVRTRGTVPFFQHGNEASRALGEGLGG